MVMDTNKVIGLEIEIWRRFGLFDVGRQDHFTINGIQAKKGRVTGKVPLAIECNKKYEIESLKIRMTGSIGFHFSSSWSIIIFCPL